MHTDICAIDAQNRHSMVKEAPSILLLGAAFGTAGEKAASFAKLYARSSTRAIRRTGQPKPHPEAEDGRRDAQRVRHLVPERHEADLLRRAYHRGFMVLRREELNVQLVVLPGRKDRGQRLAAAACR
jgi:hypothetical protein